MRGFEGPFEIEVDDEGTPVSWSSLDDYVQECLRSSGTTPENAQVYRFKIAVLQSFLTRCAHHDWSKIRRFLVEVRTPIKRVKLRGLYPRDKKVGETPQGDLPFVSMLSGEGELFKSIKFKVNLNDVISPCVKRLLREDTFAVLTCFANRRGQWAYSPAWDGTDFDSYIYVIVPNDVPANERYVEVDALPLRQKNKQLTQISVFQHRVNLT